MLSAVVIVCVF